MTEGRPGAVLLGGDGTAVPVARSLGRAGVAVSAIGSQSAPVRRSRHCSKFVVVDEGDQENWLACLKHAPVGSVILPCSDDGLEVVARNRMALEDRGLVLIEADDAVVLDVLDKERTHELALAAGVPVPVSFAVRDRTELVAAAAKVEFPCALKPLHAHEFRRQAAAKGFIAEHHEELDELFVRSEALGADMLLTELVRGPDEYESMYTYLDGDGTPLFVFTKRKLRQYPIGFGGGCYHVMNWDPEVAELGLRFFRSIGLKGLANAEFKRDVRDGELKLIEANHRFTESTALHLAAGLDLPLFTYNRLIGVPGPRVGRPYKEGIALWYPLDDFQAFRQYRRAGTLTFPKWVRSLFRRQHFAMASVTDPGPMMNQWMPRIRSGLRKGRKLLRLGPRPPHSKGTLTA